MFFCEPTQHEKVFKRLKASIKLCASLSECTKWKKNGAWISAVCLQVNRDGWIQCHYLHSKIVTYPFQSMFLPHNFQIFHIFVVYCVSSWPQDALARPSLPYPCPKQRKPIRRVAARSNSISHINKRAWRTWCYRLAGALYNPKSMMKLSPNPASYTREDGTS